MKHQKGCRLNRGRVVRKEKWKGNTVSSKKNTSERKHTTEVARHSRD